MNDGCLAGFAVGLVGGLVIALVSHWVCVGTLDCEAKKATVPPPSIESRLLALESAQEIDANCIRTLERLQAAREGEGVK